MCKYMIQSEKFQDLVLKFPRIGKIPGRRNVLYSTTTVLYRYGDRYGYLMK